MATTAPANVAIACIFSIVPRKPKDTSRVKRQPPDLVIPRRVARRLISIHNPARWSVHARTSPRHIREPTAVFAQNNQGTIR